MRALILSALCLVTLTTGSLADVNTIDPLAKPSSKLGPGFVIGLAVSVNAIDEKELCGNFPVDSEGKVELTVGFSSIGKIPLTGLTAEQAREKIQSTIGRYYAAKPEVRLVIASIPRVTVIVEGAAGRTGPVSIPTGARLSDLAAAIGTMAQTDLHSVKIIRLVDGTRKTLTADFTAALASNTDDQINDPPLRANDVVRFDYAALTSPSLSIAVLGEVRTPATYTYTTGMTVRDAQNLAQGMLPSADVTSVTISRKDQAGMIRVNGDLAMKLVATENLTLRPNDIIVVTRLDHSQKISVMGEVASSMSFDYTGPVGLKQILGNAGEFKPGADRGKVVVMRGMLQDPTRAKPILVNYDKIAKGEQPDIALEPGDVIQVPHKQKTGPSVLDYGLLIARLIFL